MKGLRITILLTLILLVMGSTSFAAVTDKYFRADKQYYDADTGVYVLSGNIVIAIEKGNIMGEQAKVKFPTQEFWGTGGWVLKQQDVTFKGDSAYVVFNKDSAQVEGNCDFQRPGLQITSDKADYNWKSKVVTFTGNVKVIPVVSSRSVDMVQYNVDTKEFIQPI